MNTVKQTSQHEQWLIDAVLRHNLPEPDRNLRLARDNGSELTTPDLAWADLKVAFFVDGLWWHVGKDDKATMEMIADEANRDTLLEGNKTRAERDGRIRSEMQSIGWRVLSCTDRNLENHKGIEQQVEIIERTLKLAQQEQAILREAAISEDDSGTQLLDLL